MSSVPMNREILDVINAVIYYGRYIMSHNYIVPQENFDHIAEMEKYYHSLPLPEGMSKNRADFDRILQIGWYSGKELERLNSMDLGDLRDVSWKSKELVADALLTDAKNVVGAMHFTIKEGGVITGACCKVNHQTGEVFDLCNEEDFLPDKFDDTMCPGEEFVVFDDRKLANGKFERVPIILVDHSNGDFESERFYWRRASLTKTRSIDDVLGDAESRSNKAYDAAGKHREFDKECI